MPNRVAGHYYAQKQAYIALKLVFKLSLRTAIRIAISTCFLVVARVYERTQPKIDNKTRTENGISWP